MSTPMSLSSRSWRNGADEKPEAVIPLLLVYSPASEKVIRAHRAVTTKYILLGLRSPWGSGLATGLVGEWQLEEYLPQVAFFYCADRNARSSAPNARRAVRSFGDKGVPHLENILYSWCPLAQFDAIGDLQMIGTPLALEALRRFEQTLKANPSQSPRSSELLQGDLSCGQAIKDLEAKQ